jgi:hypothetical protein
MMLYRKTVRSKFSSVSPAQDHNWFNLATSPLTTTALCAVRQQQKLA